MGAPDSERKLTGPESGAEAIVGPLPPGLEWSAAETLTASHAGYPSFRYVFPSPWRRGRALRPFFYATVRDAMRFGVACAAREGSHVFAVAVWLPPGAFPWSLSRKLRAMPYFLRVLAADPTRFRTFMRYGANAERAHPTDRHWYLVVAGVRPEAQRQGFGSRLMRDELEAADSEGVPVYLETADPANVAYYERFGFTVIEDALELVPGGPTHVAMRRPVGG
jgi:ribosomal protein S18 acetylase RimI-like enzyme